MTIEGIVMLGLIVLALLALDFILWLKLVRLDRSDVSSKSFRDSDDRA